MNNEKKTTPVALFLPVFIIGLIGSLIISVTDSFTKDRIALNKQATTIEIIEAVMPLTYDNDLYNDRMKVPELSTTVYRARQNGSAVGLVFMPVSTPGYKSKIKVAIGVSYDGVISGVRIIDHQETEGLGDNIDQDKSDWITNFNKRSLSNTSMDAWAVINDGGEFDQISGATISPRSVINAVKNTLDYYEIKRDNLYN